MLRGQLSTLIQDFLSRGGKIVRVPEGLVTMDWSADTKMRVLARRNAELGHEKRWGRAA